MPFELAVVLGIVQGITEFLPVSSSGHLVVFQHFLEPIFGAPKTPLAFDILVHLATLLITLLFLRRDIEHILRRGLSGGDEARKIRRLVVLLIFGTIPAVLLVLGIKDFIEASFSSVSTAANGFILTAIVLEIAHRKQVRLSSPKAHGEEALSWPLPTVAQAIVIGCAQAIAVLPGVSRSGSTIAAALILGLPADTAVRFSFFLFIPAVLGACVLELGGLQSLSLDDASAYAAGFLVTMVVGWVALRALVFLVNSAKLRYFAIYTFLLSAVLHLSLNL